jgi:hypothetical protein
MTSVSSEAASIRRFASIALVTGLCFAAAAAVVALLTGSFGDIDASVILTSIGFAVFSATGSAGAAARLRPSENMRTLGGATLLASILAAALLVAGLWIDVHDWGPEGLWRTFGCIGVLAIVGSHACLMLGALRRDDSEAIRLITLSSVGFGVFDALAVILPLANVVDDIDEPWPRIFGASLVLLVLTTALPPIMRRMQPARRPTVEGSSAIMQIADRIDLLNADPGNRAPEIQAEVNRLKKLARSFET